MRWGDGGLVVGIGGGWAWGEETGLGMDRVVFV